VIAADSCFDDFFLERRGDPRSVRSTGTVRLRERLSVPTGRLAMQPARLFPGSTRTKDLRYFPPSDSPKPNNHEDPRHGIQLRAHAHRFGLLPR